MKSVGIVGPADGLHSLQVSGLWPSVVLAAWDIEVAVKKAFKKIKLTMKRLFIFG
jgi:hypothetical protein